MSTFNENLITEVYKRSAIWNPKLQLHKDRNVISKMWDEVAVFEIMCDIHHTVIVPY